MGDVGELAGWWGFANRGLDSLARYSACRPEQLGLLSGTLAVLSLLLLVGIPLAFCCGACFGATAVALARSSNLQRAVLCALAAWAGYPAYPPTGRPNRAQGYRLDAP